MSKFGNLINQAKGNSLETDAKDTKGNSASINSGKAENNKSGNLENQNFNEKSVNLSIRVPENLRRHWVAEAKRSGTSITAEVTEALNKRFGSAG